MKCCVIVDGCSTGKYLAPLLKKKGYKCIHVQSHSRAFKIEHGGADLNDYLISYIYDGNFNKLVSFLEEYDPAFILPGSEPGVELANELANHLNLFPNAPNSGQICRNKYLTHETLRKANLPYIKQKVAKDIHSALHWAREHNIWPLVVKPLDSGGGDGFSLCHDEEDLRIAILNLMGKETIFEQRVNEILIQEFINGDEYSINCVSWDSIHYVDSIFKYKKVLLPNGHLVYDQMIAISMSEMPNATEVLKYLFKSLDALGIKYGASHNELKITKNNSVLIEANARLMGASLPPILTRKIFGKNQLDLLVLAYTNPNEFKKYIKNPYKIKKYFSSINFITKKSGIVKNINQSFVNKICKFESVAQVRPYLKSGDMMKRTIDYPTSPGDALLIHDDFNMLTKDSISIKKLAKNEELYILDKPCMKSKDSKGVLVESK